MYEVAWTRAALLGLLALQSAGCLIMGLLGLLGVRLSETRVGWTVRLIYALSFGLACLAAGGLWHSGQPRIELRLGEWVLSSVFSVRFILLLDPLSVPFLLLAMALCAVVAAFSERYLHRESGFFRFFWMLCVFGLGYSLTVLAGSIEVLYASWEMIGLASALLISFFHERPGPVRNGLYAFIVYRVCDLGLVLASVCLYQLLHSGEFVLFLGHQAWPHGVSPLPTATATLIGAFLLVAAAGKAAQIPFSGWLPRAMEGPTPSTAIFYGALSVHAGAYLMLRCAPLLETSAWLSAAVCLVGLSTALVARWVGSLQNDIKCSLAYASLAQVGLIFTEIGLGLRLLPVLHTVGHACLRSIQFLKSPSLLHDLHELHSNLGEFHVWKPEGRPPGNLTLLLYRFGLEGAFLEALVERLLLSPLLGLCALLRRFDAAVLTFILGEGE